MIVATGTFLLLWGCAGYSLGTSTLLGPVRWSTEAIRSAGASERTEDLVVIAFIGGLIAVSLTVGAVLTRAVLASRRADVRFGIPLLAVLAASGALWLWMTPAELGTDRGEELEVGPMFTFGPYPDLRRLERLRGEGYSAVISLLHPAVVPFEPKLLADERQAAAQAGIELISLPMLPWVGDNSEALARLEALAARGDGRYYIHCYLGRDRVRMARTVVERFAGTDRIAADEIAATPELADGVAFERGRVIALEDGVFLTPYPTDEELAAWIVSAGWAHVVTLLDPDNPDDRPWIDEERKALERFGIELVTVPLDAAPIDPQRVLAAVEQVQGLARPLVVHAFLGVDTGRSPVAEAFVQAWRSGLPPLPPSLFAEGLRAGAVELVGPHVATGPRPAGPEFWSLRRRGVRRVLFLGDPGSEPAHVDRQAASEAPLEWQAARRDDPRLAERLARGGPWYVYPIAPGDRLARDLATRLGPAVPTERRPELAAARNRVADGSPEAGRAGTEEASSRGASATAAVSPAAGPIAEPTRGAAAAVSAGIAAPGVLLAQFRPSMRTTILLGPSLLFAAAVAAWLAGWLRTARGVRTPYTRKIFHFAVFSAAAMLQLLGGLPLVALFSLLVSAIVLYAVWRGESFPFYEALARPTDAPRRSLFIVLPLVTTAAGGVLANLWFGAFAPVGYLVGGWGDAIGEPVGTRWGRRRYSVPSLSGVPATRSVEGSVAVIAAGSAAAFLALVGAGFAAEQAAVVALACGLLGGLVEAISHHGLDNLTIQLTASGVAFWLLA